jgi:hypothetical protein
MIWPLAFATLSVALGTDPATAPSPSRSTLSIWVPVFRLGPEGRIDPLLVHLTAPESDFLPSGIMKGHPELTRKKAIPFLRQAGRSLTGWDCFDPKRAIDRSNSWKRGKTCFGVSTVYLGGDPIAIRSIDLDPSFPLDPLDVRNFPVVSLHPWQVDLKPFRKSPAQFMKRLLHQIPTELDTYGIVFHNGNPSDIGGDILECKEYFYETDENLKAFLDEHPSEFGSRPSFAPLVVFLDAFDWHSAARKGTFMDWFLLPETPP